MATVTIGEGGKGTCQYCEKAPATKVVCGEWNACDPCAAMVAKAADESGYDAYSEIGRGDNLDSLDVAVIHERIWIQATRPKEAMARELEELQAAYDAERDRQEQLVP